MNGSLRSLLRLSAPLVPLLIAAPLVVFRAVTQAITYDEAYTYNFLLAGPIGQIFVYYNPNNHLLFSILAEASVAALGVSELSLRVPTLAAAGLFFWTAVRLSRLLTDDPWTQLLAVSLLVLNPFVLDFFVAARGYGLGLAFLAFATYVSARIAMDEGRPHPRRYLLASIALALSVCSNLTFAFPGTGLALVSIAIWLQPAPHRDRLGVRARTLAIWFVAPGLSICAALLVAPLQQARREQFTLGVDRLTETVRSLVEPSLQHHHNAWTGSTMVTQATEWTTRAGLPLIVLVAVVAAGAAVVRRRPVPRDASDPVLPDPSLPVLIGATLALTLLLVVGAHVTQGIPYPIGRTGLYFIFLVTLSLLSLVAASQHGGRTARRLSRLGLTLLALVAGQYIAELNVTHFHTWRYDAGTRDLFRIVEQQARSTGRPVRLVAHPLYEPTLLFYRALDRTDAVDIVISDRPPTSAFDFLLVPGGYDVPAALGRSDARYVHPVSGAVLIKR
ncbi:MAG: hypothetical protein GEU82_00835 [Luteitalea sp.]|nr:hypothetical protein [Luteitalea sp.]